MAEVDERGGVGTPAWSPDELLADLELRLGIVAPRGPRPVRVQAYAARMAAWVARRPFYARSFEIDPVGTASELLGWRDALVTAGWEGSAPPAGGPRLEALAALEGMSEPVLPPGDADRLVDVERALEWTPALPYAGLVLAEPQALWPVRFRRVLGLLERAGAAIEVLRPTFATAAVDSDLGRLQAHLTATTAPANHGATSIEGDGSLVLLRAETSLEAAAATAALVAGVEGVAFIRGGEELILDAALGRQAMPGLGVSATSPWRPALQVLPLTLELLFEPRDPYRVLELLTLPVSPFAGTTRHYLARALAEAPGIGGPAWTAAKTELAASLMSQPSTRGTPEQRVRTQLERIERWFERPGHDAVAGAPRVAVLEAVGAARDWLRGRLAVTADDPVLGAAHRQAENLWQAILADSRDPLSLVALRVLFDDVVGASTIRLEAERAGRPDHVADPAALFQHRATVVWWHFVEGTERRPAQLPWRQAELEALATIGVGFPERALLLAAETESWRRAVRMTRKRLVLVVPAVARGEVCNPHPFWSEIVARLAASDPDLARLTVDARALLEGRAKVRGLTAAAETLAPLPLPEARPEWRVPPKSLAREHHSASSLETLLGCPLRFAFEKVAGIRAGSVASLPDGPLLNGKLGHRLVEELHRRGHLAGARTAIAGHVGALLDELMPREAASLLGPGASFERIQLEDQLRLAATTLFDRLTVAKLVVAEVEVATEVEWNGSKLYGRIDLLLRDGRGREVVLDLKWGATSYRKLLEAGQAIQLAVYAALRSKSTGRKTLPAAGYFSLSRGHLYTTESTAFALDHATSGPSLEDTWERVERTVGAIARLLAKGTIPVTGVGASAPMAESLGLSDKAAERHLLLAPDAGCRYCACDALCGRRWEVLA